MARASDAPTTLGMIAVRGAATERDAGTANKSVAATTPDQRMRLRTVKVSHRRGGRLLPCPSVQEYTLSPNSIRYVIPVETVGEAFWEGLDITVCVSSRSTAEQEAMLDRFIVAWYEVGLFGAFGPSEHGKGVLHHMLGPLHRPDGSVQLIVDMGSAPQAALDGLIRALGVLRDEAGLPIEKIQLGEHPDFADLAEFEHD